MECNHERIKSVNCVKFCVDCGKELPPDFLPGKPAQAAEQPAEPQETAKRTTRKKVK